MVRKEVGPEKKGAQGIEGRGFLFLFYKIL
jgi:hypothetical protein